MVISSAFLKVMLFVTKETTRKNKKEKKEEVGLFCSVVEEDMRFKKKHILS